MSRVGDIKGLYWYDELDFTWSDMGRYNKKVGQQSQQNDKILVHDKVSSVQVHHYEELPKTVNAKSIWIFDFNFRNNWTEIKDKAGTCDI